jgi:uncharacterized protein YabE (DUF348 family)
MRNGVMRTFVTSIIFVMSVTQVATANPSSPSRSGLRAAVLTAKSTVVLLTVQDGSKRFQVSTHSHTVDEVLRELKIVLGPQDEISIPLASAISKYQKIEIIRVRSEISTSKVKIYLPTKNIFDKTMLKGKRKLISSAKPGLKVIDQQIFYRNNKVSKRVVLTQKILVKPQPKIVRIGTKPRTIDQLNWAAMAHCESRGNPRSSNSKYGYYGMYQFTLGAWRSVGGQGNPMDASAAEQTMRAKKFYQKKGWRVWPVCGRLLWT